MLPRMHCRPGREKSSVTPLNTTDARNCGATELSLGRLSRFPTRAPAGQACLCDSCDICDRTGATEQVDTSRSVADVASVAALPAASHAPDRHAASQNRTATGAISARAAETDPDTGPPGARKNPPCTRAIPAGTELARGHRGGRAGLRAAEGVDGQEREIASNADRSARGKTPPIKVGVAQSALRFAGPTHPWAK